MHGIFYIYLAYVHDTSEIAEHALALLRVCHSLNPLHPTPKDLKQSQPGGARCLVVHSKLTFSSALRLGDANAALRPRLEDVEKDVAGLANKA